MHDAPACCVSRPSVRSVSFSLSVLSSLNAHTHTHLCACHSCTLASCVRVYYICIERDRSRGSFFFPRQTQARDTTLYYSDLLINHNNSQSRATIITHRVNLRVTYIIFVVELQRYPLDSIHIGLIIYSNNKRMLMMWTMTCYGAQGISR